MTTMAIGPARRARPARAPHPRLDFDRKPFYSPTKIARVLSVSTKTVLDRIHDGSLHAVRISPRVYRIPLASFMLLLGEPPRLQRRLWPVGDAERFWARSPKRR